MKNVFKFIGISVLFTAVAQATQASDKIGFADPNYLVQNHPAMLEVAAKIEKTVQEIKAKFAPEEQKLAEEDKALEQEFKKMEEEAQKLQQEKIAVENALKKKVEALEKEAPRLRQKEIQARQTAINAEGKAFQDKVDKFQQREMAFDKKADEFRQKLADLQQRIEKAQQDKRIDTAAVQQQAVEEVTNAIKQIAEAKGYTVILNPSVAMYAKDESTDITDEVLNKIKAEFKPAVAK